MIVAEVSSHLRFLPGKGGQVGERGREDKAALRLWLARGGRQDGERFHHFLLPCVRSYRLVLIGCPVTCSSDTRVEWVGPFQPRRQSAPPTGPVAPSPLRSVDTCRTDSDLVLELRRVSSVRSRVRNLRALVETRDERATCLLCSCRSGIARSSMRISSARMGPTFPGIDQILQIYLLPRATRTLGRFF